MNFLGVTISLPSVFPTTAQAEHAPFVTWLVQATKPGRVVILGARDNATWLAVSQAAQATGSTTECIQVAAGGPEGGAEPAAAAGAAILSPAEALAAIEAESVDLLHVEGRNPDPAGAGALESWLSRLSPSGVLLVHGLAAGDLPGETRRFWERASADFPSMVFPHGQGLGVAFRGQPGPGAPARFAALLAEETATGVVASLFATAARVLAAGQETDALATQLKTAQAELRSARWELQEGVDDIRALHDEYANQVSQLREAAEASIRILRKPLRAQLVSRLAQGVAKLPGLSARRREKFLRSARKRDPRLAAARLSERLQGLKSELPPAALAQSATRLWGQDPDGVALELVEHADPVDIIVCVHNALDDVRACLSSIVAKTAPPYRLIVVDDGSGSDTRTYLEEFCSAQGATLLRNEVAGGYTRAANIGLKASTAPWAILLNSDVVVPYGWLDELLKIGNADARIGIVGPSSNTASWQSVPELFLADGDWSDNPLPDGVGVDDMQRILARLAPPQGIDLPFLNGFAFMIRRAVIDDIGIFDEETFGAGYGEENDYCIRARDAGWKLLFAPNAYVFHAQSKSYSTERRLKLAQAADRNLRNKHDEDTRILPQVSYCRWNLAAASLRARVAVQLEDREALARFSRKYMGKRVAFILPASHAGGGSNIVMQEASLLSELGVDTWILNMARNRRTFERNYRDPRPTVLYFEDAPEITAFVQANPLDFDAVVATAHFTVDWLPDPGTGSAPRLGYYIQDFEANFYDPDDKKHAAALATYQRLDRITGFTKTTWNAEAVAAASGHRPRVIGASVNLADFRPRGRNVPPGGKTVVAAMVRFDANVKRRSPEMTIRVLNRLARNFRDRVEIQIFGCADRERLAPLVDDSIRNMGVLPPAEVATLLRNSDVFLDFSVWQAMGLSAMEAMASGCAVVVPRNGGTTDFCQHEENALVVDTGSEDACYEAAARLVEDDALRNRLRQNAVTGICAFTQERAAMRMVETLFEEAG